MEEMQEQQEDDDEEDQDEDEVSTPLPSLPPSLLLSPLFPAVHPPSLLLSLPPSFLHKRTRKARTPPPPDLDDIPDELMFDAEAHPSFLPSLLQSTGRRGQGAPSSS